jgi:hypothetical protein
MSYSDRAGAVIKAFSSRLQQASIAMPQMCAAAWLKSKTPLRQVRVADGDSIVYVMRPQAAQAFGRAARLLSVRPGGAVLWHLGRIVALCSRGLLGYVS